MGFFPLQRLPVTLRCWRMPAASDPASALEPLEPLTRPGLAPALAVFRLRAISHRGPIDPAGFTPVPTGRQPMARARAGSFIAAYVGRRTGPNAQPARGLVGMRSPDGAHGVPPFAALLPDNGRRRFRQLNPHAVQRFGHRRLFRGGQRTRRRRTVLLPWPIRPGFRVFRRPSRTVRPNAARPGRRFPETTGRRRSFWFGQPLLPWAFSSSRFSDAHGRAGRVSSP